MATKGEKLVTIWLRSLLWEIVRILANLTFVWIFPLFCNAIVTSIHWKISIKALVSQFTVDTTVKISSFRIEASRQILFIHYIHYIACIISRYQPSNAFQQLHLDDLNNKQQKIEMIFNTRNDNDIITLVHWFRFICMHTYVSRGERDKELKKVYFIA